MKNKGVSKNEFFINFKWKWIFDLLENKEMNFDYFCLKNELLIFRKKINKENGPKMGFNKCDDFDPNYSLKRVFE